MEEPALTVRVWRKLCHILKAWRSAGDIPGMLVIFLPRLTVSYMVVTVAQMARAIAKLLGTSSSYEPKANLRILIVTDYMPPQTHGIAIRFRNYIDNMRLRGHEVQVFSTNITKDRETSFDHPNLPAIVNPFNTHNKMAYNPGVKLSYYLGAKQWDLVHLVYPSNIGVSILPVCAWRRIPVYCSHHVDMEYYIDKYMHFELFAWFGAFLYWTLVKLPAVRLANVNAAPTLTFLDAHLPAAWSGSRREGRKGPEPVRRRIPSGVAAARFKVDDPAQLEEERRDLLRSAGADPAGAACVWLMVQRLAPEKATMVLLDALATMRAQGEGRPLEVDGRPLYLVIAGDGPAREQLSHFASERALPVTFLGNLSQTALPPLYRAADVFVTCSTSETYGLTVLEALACGTPVVLPHCGVFDELWAEHDGRAAWFYYPSTSSSGAAAQGKGVGSPPSKHRGAEVGSAASGGDNQRTQRTLIEALRCASTRACKAELQARPIKASWADAADDLLAQYQQAIQANLPYRQELASFTHAFNQLARAALICLFMWWLLKEYTIELSLLASRLAGVDLETLRGPEPRKRPPFWQPLKPFLRVLAEGLRRLGED